tara:strand:+ start:5385 stop:6851 length:1467 start_codon:yes stop_codon:yes gene_type:complete
LEKIASKNSFLSNVIKLGIAPIISQSLSFFLMPVISRLYTPTYFGYFNIYSSFTDPLSSIANLGYHQAILIPKSDKKAITIFYLSLISLIIFSLMISVLITIIPINQTTFFDYQKYGYIITLAPFSILLQGLNMSFLGLNQRLESYTEISISRISNPLINKVFVVIAGLVGFASTKSLIIGLLLGLLSSVIIQGSSSIYFILKYPKKIFTFQKIIDVAKDYKKFPLFVMSTDLLYRLGNSITVFLIAYIFSAEVSGHYGMSVMMAGIPSALIGSAISEVFYQKTAKIKIKGDAKTASENLLLILIKLSMLPFMILAVFSKDLFIVLLGESWTQAGIITSILSFQMFISFVMAPILQLSKVYDKQEYLLFSQILMLITSFFSIIIGSFFGGLKLTFLFFSISNGLVIFFFGLLTLRLIDISSATVVKIILKNLIKCVPFLILAILLRSYFLNSNLILVLISISILIGYFVYLYWIEKDLKALSKSIFVK